VGGFFLLKNLCLSNIFFSIVFCHDPYFHEISLPIDAGHDELSFVFSKSDIFVIIALEAGKGSGNK